MNTDEREERPQAPGRIWIDAAPHLIADATRHIYVEPPPPHFRDFNSVEYVRADLFNVGAGIRVKRGAKNKRKLERDAATRMRNLCLEKVREIPMPSYLSESGEEIVTHFRARVIRYLESLTLDSTEQREEKDAGS